MPLMWINSVMVSLFIFLMLVNMYCIGDSYKFVLIEMNSKENLVKLMW